MCPPAIAAGHAFGQLLKPAPETHTPLAYSLCENDRYDVGIPLCAPQRLPLVTPLASS